MSVDFEDYYDVLGVERSASQDQIQKAYRKLARKYHPDVSKEDDAEEIFKKVNEAHEVLKDPESRKKYDQLGKNWKHAQQGGQPPPGWAQAAGGAAGASFEDIFGSAGAQAGGARGGQAGFSDFFNTFFGGQGPGAGAGQAGFGGQAGGFNVENLGGFGAGGRRAGARSQKGRSREATLRVALADVAGGVERTIELPVREQRADGRIVERTKSYNVKIPAGTTNGTVIRLAGQGEPSRRGGKPGDLRLRVDIADHPVFEVDGHDLSTELNVTPWEAALGAKVDVPTLGGPVTLTLPAGSQSGSKLRLRGKGLPTKSGDNGNLYAHVFIRVPDELDDQERELFEQLQATSDFDPRG